jgi:hypothetical protein
MVSAEPPSELQDAALASEIELLSDLIEAVAQAGRQLSPAEIDGALGVRRASRPASAAHAAALVCAT